MDRREWLKLIGAGAAMAAAPLILPKSVSASPKYLKSVKYGRYGWLSRPEAAALRIENAHLPFISDQNQLIRGSGEGKKALWWRAFEKVTETEFVPHYQGIGDCVSHGFGLGVDFLTAIQVETRSRHEKWMGKCATEILYGGGRCEVGNQYGRYSDGSTGFWQAEFLTEYGVLLRQKYPGGFDYTTYNPQTAKRLGTNGVPDELEDLCREHPVKTASLVTNWEDCRDAIYNGYMVAVCSNVGFGQPGRRRDRDGFLRRQGRWGHCMLLAGMDDEYKRPGALSINSWGPKSAVGPTRHNQPAGSFWIDASTVDSMLRQQDSFALSDYIGYPSRVIPPYVIW